MPQHFVPASAQEQNLLGRRQSVRAQPRRAAGTAWWRAFRLCVLAVLLPSLLVAGPLYLRYRVYYATMYPLGISDMRMINAHVSTTWCQGQTVQANTTYNAYVVDGAPGVSLEPQRVSMSRQLVLEDDMKEYWAFYLLRGSSVTISTCVRWQGASLIVIKGHRHLHECAYIGDNSSEEEDELQEEEEERVRRLNQASEEDPSNKTNTPDLMRRFRPGVVFHDSEQAARASQERLSAGSSSDYSDEDSLVASLLLKKATARARLKQTPSAGTPLPPTSGEVLDDLLKKIRDLGPRGREVLQKLNQQVELEGEATSSGDQDVHRRRRREGARSPREIIVNPGGLQEVLNAHDRAGDAAIEEELNPDGIADHHRKLNQTTAGDHSNSEVWSSFSSSEEALLHCAGLVLNLPLQPHRRCDAHRSPEEHAAASLQNTVTYKVPSNGYYFFVFSSENEIQPNYIRVHFHLEKTVYDVSHPVASCRNATGSCSLPLGFWSSDTVVLEVPLDANASMGYEEFFARSECQPRTAVYLACIIAVPLFIVLFAFH